jgi:multidrug transporter EmrE-like cation transporter
MIQAIAGLSFLKTFSPYMRNHIMEGIAPWEFMFINSVLIGTICFVYSYVHKKEKLSNLLNLTPIQIGAALVLSVLAVVSGLFYLSMEKDNVLTTSFLWRGIGTAVFVATGILLFNEKLEWHQILGIVAVVAGSLLVAHET